MNDSITIKPIYKIKDVQLLCHTEQLRVKVVKEYLDESQHLIKKEHDASTYSLVNIGDEEAEKKVKALIGEVCFSQAKEIGILNDRINAMSKECAQKVSIAQKECSEKMILQTELLNAKDALKAHEENFNIAKSINDEIYAENQKLKADKETLKLEKQKTIIETKVIESPELLKEKEFLASENEKLNLKIVSMNDAVLSFNTENTALKASNKLLEEKSKDYQDSLTKAFDNIKLLSAEVEKLKKVK